MTSTLRHRTSFVLFLLLTIGMAAFAYISLGRNPSLTRHLYEPKVHTMLVGTIPVQRTGSRPVMVMAGLPVEISCDIVAPPDPEDRPLFRFRLPDGVHEETVCRITATFAGAPGAEVPFSFEYLVRKADGTTSVVDTWQLQVRLVAPGEHVRVHAFETPDGTPVQTLTLPEEVIPYVEAAIRLDGEPSAYTTIFLVHKLGLKHPVLQISVPPDAPHQWKPLTADVKRYRQYGGDIYGYASWPTEPIQVGNREETREVFEVYTAILRVTDLEALKAKALSFEKLTDGRAVFEVGSLTLDDVRALAYHGLLSEPIRVVRSEKLLSESKTAWRTE